LQKDVAKQLDLYQMEPLISGPLQLCVPGATSGSCAPLAKVCLFHFATRHRWRVRSSEQSRLDSCSYMAPRLCRARDGHAPGSVRAPQQTQKPLTMLHTHQLTGLTDGEPLQHPLTTPVTQAGKFLQQGLTAPEIHSDTKW